MVQRRELDEEERVVALWREPDVSLTAFFSLYIFSFSFPLSWPVALNGRFSYICRKEIRGYEFRPSSVGPIVMQLARFAVRNLVERISIPDRFGFIGYLTLDRSAPRKMGDPWLDRIIHLTSCNLGLKWEFFLREDRSIRGWQYRGYWVC